MSEEEVDLQRFRTRQEAESAKSFQEAFTGQPHGIRDEFGGEHTLYLRKLLRTDEEK